MKVFQLSAEPRTVLGKKAAKALRAENRIPVVLNGGASVELPYTGTLKEGEKIVELGNGKGLITTDLVVTAESVRKLIYTPEIFAIELDIHGVKRMAVIKDLQFHPVTDSLLHIDLLEVFPEKPIVFEVPVKLEGHAEGVTDIPERLVINVDHLALGKSMAVGDIHIEGIELVNAKNAVVCAVQLTRAARGAAAANAGA